MANILARCLAETSSSSHYSSQFQILKTTAESKPLKFQSNNTKNYNLPFSLWELKQALQKSNNSATGPDEVHYNLLTRLPESVLSVLLKVYNSIRESETFHPSWREAVVVHCTLGANWHRLNHFTLGANWHRLNHCTLGANYCTLVANWHRLNHCTLSANWHRLNHCTLSANWQRLNHYTLSAN